MLFRSWGKGVVGYFLEGEAIFDANTNSQTSRQSLHVLVAVLTLTSKNTVGRMFPQVSICSLVGSYNTFFLTFSQNDILSPFRC